MASNSSNGATYALSQSHKEVHSTPRSKSLLTN